MQLESSKVIVIFDVDGTINQTEVYAVKAYRKALEEVGKTGFSDKEFIERIGAPFEQDVRYFFGENQSEQVEIFKTLIQKYWIDGMKESAKTFEGIHQMLEGLKEKGYKLAICSNASKWELDVILRKLEVNDYFEIKKIYESSEFESTDQKIFYIIYLSDFKRSRNCILQKRQNKLGKQRKIGGRDL